MVHGLLGRATGEPIFKSVGGSVLGFWYGVGGSDVYVLGELPDDVVSTSLAATVAASGAFSSVTTTRLLSVEEMLKALGGSAHGLPRPGPTSLRGNSGAGEHTGGPSHGRKPVRLRQRRDR